MKKFWYDLETTGTYPGKHGIHQIAGCIEIDGDKKEWFNFKVRPNPKAQIDPEALKIANVTLEQIMAYPPMEEVYAQLLVILGKYCDKFNKSDKFHLVGYNNRGFDDQFLRGFFLQNNDNYFGSWFWSDSIDVLVLASDFLAHERHKLENFQLRTVARHLGIWVDKQSLHDAEYDITITRDIYRKIKQYDTTRPVSNESEKSQGTQS